MRPLHHQYPLHLATFTSENNKPWAIMVYYTINNKPGKIHSCFSFFFPFFFGKKPLYYTQKHIYTRSICLPHHKWPHLLMLARPKLVHRSPHHRHRCNAWEPTFKFFRWPARLCCLPSLAWAFMENRSASLAPSSYPAIHALRWNWGTFWLFLRFFHFIQALVLHNTVSCSSVSPVARKCHVKRTISLPEWRAASNFWPPGTRDVRIWYVRL